jgi:hypothetical protein
MRHFRPYLVMLAVLVGLTGLVQLSMGRLLMSKSGRVMLWVPHANSSENSQQIADWYSFSHLIHGFLFYGALHLLTRRRPWPVPTKFTAAVLVECAWEVLENTPFVINRYRTATASLDYFGDTVLNSACDVMCCALGLALARRMPVWASVMIVVFLELLAAYAIRDNLTLNVIMLLYPVEAIRRWQQGLPVDAPA